MNIGLLIIRVIVGLTFMGHGSQKLFGTFGGNGLKATSKGFESMGLKPGMIMALLAGLAEFVGGALFVLGFITWLGDLLIVITMLVGIFKVHGKNGYWITQGGFEYNLILIAIAVGIFFTGPGNISLDALIF